MSLRLAVLLSGGGRTLLNLLDAVQQGRIDAQVPLVICSRGDVAGVERARARGLNVTVLRPRDFPEQGAFAAQLVRQVQAANVHLVVMAGWLVHLPIPAGWEGRVLNIHPSLLPRHGGQGMYGDRVHAAVLRAGDTESGCTVHLVDDEYDHGPVLAQSRVPVLPLDDSQTLAERVFAAECRTYPEAIAHYASQLQSQAALASLGSATA